MAKPNWPPKTLFLGDNLPIMREMNSATVDLCYLDPPFNAKRGFAAAIGSASEGQRFYDVWKMTDVTEEEISKFEDNAPEIYLPLRAAQAANSDGMAAYLLMMAPRLQEIHRILKPAGSVYLHCDPHAAHYLKMIMDGIFGRKNFRNEISWKRMFAIRGAKKHAKQFARASDNILFYTKSENKHHFSPPRLPLSEKQKRNYRYTDKNGRRYRTSHLGAYSEDSIEKMRAQGLIHTSPSGVESKKYYLDEAWDTIGSVWDDLPGFGERSGSREYLGWPTQKPLALLKRIIKTSSKEGDVVFDPFCGCATAMVAAENLNRAWVGIDSEVKAKEIILHRLSGGVKQQIGIWRKEINIMTRPPKRTDKNLPAHAALRAQETAAELKWQTRKEVQSQIRSGNVAPKWKEKLGYDVAAFAMSLPNAGRKNYELDHLLPFRWFTGKYGHCEKAVIKWWHPANLEWILARENRLKSQDVLPSVEAQVGAWLGRTPEIFIKKKGGRGQK